MTQMAQIGAEITYEPQLRVICVICGLMLVVFFPDGSSVSCGLTLVCGAFNRTVLLDARRGIPGNLVRMNVGGTVHECPPPRRVINNDRMRSPCEMCRIPAPRHKGSAQRDAEAEPDRPAHYETGPRPRKHDQRIVVGNHDIVGIDR